MLHNILCWPNLLVEWCCLIGCCSFGYCSFTSCSFLQLSTTATMPKKAWAAKDQIDWLTSQLPDFRLAQESKTTPDFFAHLYEEFYTLWPLPPPTSGELAEAEGDEEQARTTKRKSSESVCNYFAMLPQKLICMQANS